MYNYFSSFFFLSPFLSYPSSLQATAFTDLLEASGGEEEDGYKALTALGLISAVQALVKSAINKPELLRQMETVLVNGIASILQNGVMGEYSIVNVHIFAHFSFVHCFLSFPFYFW